MFGTFAEPVGAAVVYVCVPDVPRRGVTKYA